MLKTGNVMQSLLLLECEKNYRLKFLKSDCLNSFEGLFVLSRQDPVVNSS